MGNVPENERSSVEQTAFAELDHERSEMKVFELLLKIESRLRKEARDDLRARKESRFQELQDRSHPRLYNSLARKNHPSPRRFL
jgi:hypothetical protein